MTFCSFAVARQIPAQRELFYIGTKGQGEGQGVFAATLDPSTGKLSALGLAAQAERPTWLAIMARPRVLYAVNEIGNDGAIEGRVASYRIDPTSGTLTLINAVGSGGGGATHLALAPDHATLFVANYGGATIAALPLRPDGGLAAPSTVRATFGTGPSPRQTSPHPHGVAVDPSGRYLLAPDLGADRIFIYRLDAATGAPTPAPIPFAATPAGSGPRHILFSRDGRLAFVNTELDASIRSFAWDAKNGQLRPLATTPTSRPGFDGPKSAGEIVLSADGRFLYASHRGENALIVYRVRDGRLSEIQRLASGGKTPGHFAIDPTGRWLLVANEGSNAIALFSIDPRRGVLAPQGQSLAAPSPVNIAFSPQ